MEALKFSRKSWHHRLATKYANFDAYAAEGDLCKYMRSVVFGAVLVLFLTALLAFTAVSFESLIIWAIVCIQQGIMIKPAEITIAALALILLAVVVGVVAAFGFIIFGGLDVLERRRMAGKPDPFVINVIKSTSQKICKRVEFV